MNCSENINARLSTPELLPTRAASSASSIEINAKAGDTGEAEEISDKQTQPTSSQHPDFTSHLSSKTSPSIFEPDSWVLDHHKDGLVLELEEPHSIFDHIRERTSNNQDPETASTSSGVWKTRRFRISFAELQSMHLRKLQSKLAKHAIDMRYSKVETEGWETDLESYIKAVKDYEYMTACSKRERDPFLATGEYWVDHRMIQETMDNLPWRFRNENFYTVLSSQKWKGSNDISTICGNRGETNRQIASKAFYRRVMIAAVGGAFLLGPMWLMVLHHTLYTALVSTTVAVVLFGFVMAWNLDKDSDVLTSTATYAAVLVVFVGLNVNST